MRYILVNCKSDKGEPQECAFCPRPIGKTYVRDLETRVTYCSVACLEVHIHESTQYLIEYQGGCDARPMR